jgi:hypothetical protein
MFSPYGEPIKAHFAFRLRDRLVKVDAQRWTKEDAGFTYDSDDGVELEDPPPTNDQLQGTPTTEGDSKRSPPSWDGLSNKERKRRLKKRSKRAGDANPKRPHIKGVTVRQHMEAIPLKTNLDPEALPVASSGWVGSQPAEVKEEYALEELLGPELGMKLVDWDGQTVCLFLDKTLLSYPKFASRIPHPLIDWESHVTGALTGQPQERWGEVVSDATAGIKAARYECAFTDKQNDHQRGHFPALVVGISYGGGRKVSHLP